MLISVESSRPSSGSSSPFEEIFHHSFPLHQDNYLKHKHYADEKWDEFYWLVYNLTQVKDFYWRMFKLTQVKDFYWRVFNSTQVKDFYRRVFNSTQVKDFY